MKKMKILNILVKEIKENVRNIRSMALMILFPIVLMFVLGTALSGVFDNSSQFKDINVLYTQEGDPSLNSAFNTFLAKGQEIGIHFTQAEGVQQGIEGVQNGKYAGFIRVSESGVQLYKNDRDAFKANLVETILGSFLQRYNAVATIAKVNPALVSQMVNQEGPASNQFVQLSSLGDRKQPSAMDYYAITMLTLITLYSAMTGAAAIKGERTLKTLNRLLCSPIRKDEILIGKILGALAITLLQALVVLAFSKIFLKTYWGDHMGTVLMLVMSEIIMAVSLGMGIAFVTKNDKEIINLLIPLIGFFGGGYIPIEALGGTVQKLSGFSPLRWINQSLFSVVFSNDLSTVTTAILINLAVAAVFLVLSTWLFRKEAI